MSPPGDTAIARLGRTRRRLRFRVVLSFALGSLVLTTTLAVVTYGLIDRYLLRQRERTAQRQAFLDARTFRDDIETKGADVTVALQNLELPTGTSVVVRRANVWYGTSLAIGRTSLPSELRALVARSTPAQQRITLAGTTALVIGLPIRSIEAEYFEIAVFTELDNSLGVVRNSLIGAAGITTIAAALLGVWVGRRALRPLHDVSTTASEIAGGNLGRRLDPSDDPDLEPLTGSFNQMVDALQERIDRDARFVSDVSHEIRSPLTTLATAGALIEARLDEIPARLREPIQLLLVEVQRFQRLAIELLELSRSGATNALVDPEPVLIGELVTHATVAAGLERTLPDIEPRLFQDPILSDKRRLDRVLANLLENADTHGGGVTAITARRTPAGITIAIEDAGPGIPVSERARVFERFYRGVAAGRRGDGSGTGLGLALVAEHIRILGGSVLIEDATDSRGGARFVVIIPDLPA